ncbi:MAG TPA: aldo/keto reductase [Solirubrobacteraceae bacterium]|nr:aldo/keto reductase [Solirubrobacteraceae bacterium]
MTASSTDVPKTTLADGVEIPQLGFGVWQVPPQDAAAVVGEAFKAGYRHIDTAQMYENEQGVGEAFHASGLARDEVFITTKCNNHAHGAQDAIKALETSLRTLALDHVDLYLIHWPQPGKDLYVETWQGFIEAQKRGLTRAIGVSNFHRPHLDRIIQETGVTPAVNQIELHPRLTQQRLVADCRELGIAIESWSPLASGEILEDPTLEEIARAHGKSVAQTVIRWHLQLGYIVIPKSVTPERIVSNFDVFDFELSADELERISSLHSGGRTGPDPDQFG